MGSGDELNAVGAESKPGAATSLNVTMTYGVSSLASLLTRSEHWEIGSVRRGYADRFAITDLTDRLFPACLLSSAWKRRP